ELVSGSSRVPQLRFPPTAAGTLSGAAGYYDLLPFAGLVGSGGAVGLLSIGGKYRMLSESDGAPVGLAVHAHFGIPIHKSIDFLLTHPVGTEVARAFTCSAGYRRPFNQFGVDKNGFVLSLAYSYLPSKSHLAP